jgi:hypothetical protein
MQKAIEVFFSGKLFISKRREERKNHENIPFCVCTIAIDVLFA